MYRYQCTADLLYIKLERIIRKYSFILVEPSSEFFLTLSKLSIYWTNKYCVSVTASVETLRFLAALQF